MSDFKTRLKEERKRLGLNQEKFAQIGGVSKDTQVNYESGLRVPDVDYLIAVGAAGVDTQYLLSGVSSETQLSEEERELLTASRLLSEEAFASVMAMVNSLGPNRRNKHIIRLTADEQARVEAMAQQHDVSVSEMIRMLALNEAKQVLDRAPGKGSSVIVHGKVGQHITGDIHGTVQGPVMGKTIVKKK
ncbi:helix-turn-helix domain-containing protein [Herbaspirillum seropedicae]|uniref:helix-turn-helix domain-containing protein n=1 Tax=Herbaspirillum seropedicae TaxID=964 RepID=UPI003D98E4F4